MGKHGQSSSVKLFCNRAVMLSELRVWAEATVAAKLRVKFLNVCFKHKSDSISSRQKPYPLQTHAGPGLIHVSFNPRSKASRISMPEGRTITEAFKSYLGKKFDKSNENAFFLLCQVIDPSLDITSAFGSVFGGIDPSLC